MMFFFTLDNLDLLRFTSQKFKNDNRSPCIQANSALVLTLLLLVLYGQCLETVFERGILFDKQNILAIKKLKK